MNTYFFRSTSFTKGATFTFNKEHKDRRAEVLILSLKCKGDTGFINSVLNIIEYN